MTAFAQLAMYPFAELRAEWEHLWRGVRRHVPWAPDALSWPDDLPGSWRSPDLIVGMTCGWPLFDQLGDSVRVVGAFRPQLDSSVARGTMYRSRIVAGHNSLPTDEAELRVAANSSDSMSGWVSLRAAGWRTPIEHVLWTGAHVDSLRAIARGDADVASIDAVTFELLARLHPELTAAVRTVGFGPWVHALPVITAAATTDTELADLRAAFNGVGRVDPLCIDGFEPLEFEHYASILNQFARETS